ncbi:hypothetical protein [Oceanospirillum sediminis]|uniref:Glycerophosphoryl diester phosphodiesterase membrane domain-containing protein n=1 Tax=Oceanospirillum sediminis TaxID=2760088 RepID=A0A839IR38_9GAMM|nr:hypothetical protein [Oceanospirillum sediminis]MBB1487745.1 hypothetical protein [Oceanospirillum sediminis]
MFQDLNRLLKDSFEFFFANFTVILSLILPVLLPVTIFGLFAEQAWIVEDNSNAAQVYASIAFVNALTYPLYHAALIRFMHDRINGHQIAGAGAYYFSALRLWLPLLILNLMIGFSILAGLLLLIIPGLILMVRMTFAEFYCVLEQKKPVTAFKLSWQDTKADFWLILTGAGVIYMTLFTLESGLSMLFGDNTLGVVMDAVLRVFFGVCYTLFTIFAYRMYVRHVQLSQDNDQERDDDSRREDDQD